MCLTCVFDVCLLFAQAVCASMVPRAGFALNINKHPMRACNTNVAATRRNRSRGRGLTFGLDSPFVETQRARSCSSDPSATGILRVNIAPLLTPALAAESDAPCSLASRLAIASPSPSPPTRRSGPCSSCVNGSNNLFANCSLNPTPESRTVTTASPAFCANDSSTVPPAGVNLMAFDKRLSRICRSRTRSALTKQGLSANCAIRCNPACCARGAAH